MHDMPYLIDHALHVNVSPVGHGRNADPLGSRFLAALVPPGRQITSQAQGLNVLVFELKEILRIG